MTYDINGDTVDPQNAPKPHYTPNVNIENPRIRKVANAIIQTVGIVIVATIAVDAASADVDWSAWTLPALAGVTSLASAYGLIVTQPNIPTR